MSGKGDTILKGSLISSGVGQIEKNHRDRLPGPFLYPPAETAWPEQDAQAEAICRR
jgi:hypothetical protein